jgi:hypothetical protein
LAHRGGNRMADAHAGSVGQCGVISTLRCAIPFDSLTVARTWSVRDGPCGISLLRARV